MDISTCGLRFVMAKLFIPAFALTVMGHASPAYTQQTTTPPAPAEIAKLRPGMWCQVWTRSPPSPSPRSDPDDGGTIQEVTKEEIVVSRISEGRNEYKTPILGDLPLIGRFFTKVSVGRAETISRIPIAKIARIKILEPDRAAGKGKPSWPND